MRSELGLGRFRPSSPDGQKRKKPPNGGFAMAVFAIVPLDAGGGGLAPASGAKPLELAFMALGGESS